MITAWQARAIINSANVDRWEMKVIEHEIMRAVERGENNCFISYISDNVVNWLKSLGYSVRRSHKRKGEKYTEIKW